MLERLLNKKLEVRVALYSDSMPRGLYSDTYEGKLVAYDETFMAFEDDTMINIKYVQLISVL